MPPNPHGGLSLTHSPAWTTGDLDDFLSARAARALFRTSPGVSSSACRRAHLPLTPPLPLPAASSFSFLSPPCRGPKNCVIFALPFKAERSPGRAKSLASEVDGIGGARARQDLPPRTERSHPEVHQVRVREGPNEVRRDSSPGESVRVLLQAEGPEPAQHATGLLDGTCLPILPLLVLRVVRIDPAAFWTWSTSSRGPRAARTMNETGPCRTNGTRTSQPSCPPTWRGAGVGPPRGSPLPTLLFGSCWCWCCCRCCCWCCALLVKLEADPLAHRDTCPFLFTSDRCEISS